MSPSKTRRKTAAIGGIALTTIALGMAAANASPASIPNAAAAAADVGAARPADGLGRGPGGHGPGGHGGPRGEGAAALAEKLGVEESALKDAMGSVRGTIRENGRDALPGALAQELGVDEAAVTSALDEVRTERRAENRRIVAERLDDAVTDGTLTEADKDSVLKAIDAGVIGGGHR